MNLVADKENIQRVGCTNKVKNIKQRTDNSSLLYIPSLFSKYKTNQGSFSNYLKTNKDGFKLQI